MAAREVYIDTNLKHTPPSQPVPGVCSPVQTGIETSIEASSTEPSRIKVKIKVKVKIELPTI
jgi:hypothetical protein